MSAKAVAGVFVLASLATSSWGQISYEFAVHVGSSNQLQPGVWGEFVTWQEYRGDGIWGLYGKYLNQTQVITLIEAPNVAAPAVRSGIVVWADQRNGGPVGQRSDIFAYDVATGEEFAVCTRPGRQFYPAVDGDWIVYEHGQYGDNDVYAYNINSGQERPIALYPYDQSGPDISGRYVVWTDERNYGMLWVEDGKVVFGGYDVYGYDLETGQPFVVTDASGDQGGAVISGNAVVWGQWSEATGADIWGKDLSTGAVFPICTAPGGQGRADIDGNIVVWIDGRSRITDYADIYGYDLSTGREFPIRIGALYPTHVKISGNVVVWQEDAVPGQSRIYGAIIPEPGTAGLLLWGALLLLRGRLRPEGRRS